MSTSKKHRAVSSISRIIFGTRCCSKCEQTKPNHNGKYEVFNNGKNQRWICADCSPAEGEEKRLASIIRP